MRIFALLFLALPLACSGSSGTDLVGAGSSSGSSGSTPDGGAVDASENPLATGTCGFAIDGTSFSLPGFAAMNGSGNLEVRCADATRKLDLDVGNGTYRGPGQYAFSDQLRRGSLDLETPTHFYRVGFSSGGPAATCTVNITEAPATSFAPLGSAIKGTLTCTAVQRFPKDDKGRAAKESDGSFNLTAGGFALSIQ